MNILNMEHISKVFGDKLIFDDVSYGIHDGDKIGIIGMNGSGKSTFLKMMAGQEEPDEGRVMKRNGINIAYLPQNPEFPDGKTILSYVTAGADTSMQSVESEAKIILNKLGITEYDVKLGHLSGGQKKRAALAKTLLASYEILILDEPTNHLDEEMLTWLEDYLTRLKSVVIMVTHDRYFLDKVTNKILEISSGKLYGYEANYSRFLELKAQREEMELASERKRQSTLRIELEWAKRGCRARSTKQKARLERLEALKNGTVPAADQVIEMDSAETRMGKKTIELHHVSKSYGEKKIIDDFNYIVLKNQRLGIIGPNGSGKTTLMKIIAGELNPDAGEVEIGETVKIGYFAQEEVDMNPNQRVIDYIRDIAEYIPMKEGKISASQLLERFLFDANMQYTYIGKLSGGEKRRLYLLSILAMGANTCIFDEPSNSLDIPTLTILEDYLNSFSGIVIIVSHDRYFLDNVVDRIFAFEGEGKLRQYEGGYTEYLKAKQAAENIAEMPSGKKNPGEPKKSEKDWKKNKPTKLKFSFKEQIEYETIDDDIAALEEKIHLLEAEMEANASQYTKLAQLTEEKEAVDKKLDEKMDRWVYLNSLAESIEAQSVGY